jgi:gliding motility-associated-like protein
LLILLTLGSILTNAQTVNKTQGCAPLTNVNFTSNTPGNWSFGNGSSAINQTNATANYGSPGTYIATFSQGGTEVWRDTITVFGNPSPIFSPTNTNGCIPFTTTFNNTSVGGGGSAITKHEWSFGDGGTSLTQNPTYTYTIVGTYNVSLTVTDANGCDSATTLNNLITVGAPPNASFTTTPSPANSCTAPFQVTIINNSTNSTGGTNNLEYLWDFGNGETSTLSNPNPVTYTQNGSYTIRLTVSQTGSCSREFTRNVVIGSPIANFFAPDTICVGTSQQLTNTSLGANSYQWTIGNSNYTSANPTHVFNTPGLQQIKLVANSNLGCSGDTIKEIFIDAVTADFTRTPSYICDEPYCIQYNSNVSNNVTQYSWNFGSVGNSSLANPQFCYPIDTSEYYIHNRKLYTVLLDARNERGCSIKRAYTDTIYPLTAFFIPDIHEGCAPLTVNFSDSTRSRESIVSWNYNFGDGNFSNQENPTHTFTSPGEYLVVLNVQNAYGCRDTSYPVLIKVGEPVAQLNFNISPTTVCVGDTVTFTDTNNNPNINFVYFDVEGMQSKGCKNGTEQYFIPTNSIGSKDVTYKVNYNGCISQNTIPNAITINGSVSEFHYLGDCSTPLTYSFVHNIQGATSWEWNYGDGNTSGNLNSGDTISHTYGNTGDYTITLTTQSAGCPNQEFTQDIKVRDVQAVISPAGPLCADVDYLINANNTIDADADCNAGYHWDRGPKTPVTITGTPNNTFRFNSTGNALVRLIAKDINGCKDTATLNITITDVKAGISADKITGCMPLTVNFNDTSKSNFPITSYTWQVGNNTISNRDTAKLVLTNVTIPSTTIRLFVQDSLGCKDTTQMIISPILPDTSFTANILNRCTGDSILFTPSSSGKLANFAWDFGDNTPIRNGRPIRYAYNAGGIYTVTLTVTDTNGCKGTRTRSNYITIQDYPQAGFTTSLNNTFTACYPANVQFNDTSISLTTSSRTWDLGTGGAVVTTPTVGTTYNAPGVYKTSLIRATSFGCRDTAEIDINIIGPVASIEIDKNNLCVGESITINIKDSSNVSSFAWDFGDGTNSININPVTHRYSAYPVGGSTIVQLIMYTKDSVCSATSNQTLNIREVEARFTVSDSILCISNPLNIINNSLGADVTKWAFNNEESSIDFNPDPINFNTTGPYSIRLIVENSAFGCIDTLTRTGLIVNNPIINNTNNADICRGDSVFYQVNGALNYSWEPAVYASNPNAANTYLFPDLTTTFTLTATDNNGCTTIKNPIISVIQPISTIFTEDTCVVVGDEFTIGQNFGPQYSYLWSGSNTSWINCLTCPILENTRITKELGNIELTLTYTDSLNCFKNKVEFELCILPSYTVSLPDGFSPDGDNINDVIKVRGHGIKELLEFKIYNRWGELVYEGKDIEQGWDGVYKNARQGSETFVYQVTVLYLNDKTESKSGSFTLVR